MAVYVCKMCGANINVPAGTYEFICEYCGTQQTISQDAIVHDHKRLRNLLDRSLEDHEWKKALHFYEEALNIDSRCAQAYWGEFLAENHFTVPEILDGSFISQYENYDTEIVNINYAQRSAY